MRGRWRRSSRWWLSPRRTADNVALFSMGWSVVVLIVEIVLAIWVGTIIME